jgi:hypothetical protein
MVLNLGVDLLPDAARYLNCSNGRVVSQRNGGSHTVALVSGFLALAAAIYILLLAPICSNSSF